MGGGAAGRIPRAAGPHAVLQDGDGPADAACGAGLTSGVRDRGERQGRRVRLCRWEGGAAAQTAAGRADSADTAHGVVPSDPLGVRECERAVRRVGGEGGGDRGGGA